jgi:hypothetical protein
MNGVIKRHFGKHTTTGTKSRASLCYGSDKLIINMRDAQNLEDARMRFLKPLLGLTRLDRQRSSDIRNYRLEVDNRVQGIQLYQNYWLRKLKWMDRSRLPKLAFQYQPRGRRDVGRPRRRWRDQEHVGL